MQDNGMGGRRIGKKYYGGISGNVEEATDYWSESDWSTTSADEWADLINSYNEHNKFIKSQKSKWLTPKVRQK